jgi:dTDP-glucose pyrophosphorylase
MTSRIETLSISTRESLRGAMTAIDRGGCEIALVVDEAGSLLGTLTDGDIRRALLADASLEETASRYMKRTFTCVGPETGRAEILDLMRARYLQQIPIVDATGRLVGLHLLREVIGAAKRENWAVIMAGGRGERLRPITDHIPKPMVRVAGRPILERMVLHLVGFGIQRIFLSINYLGEQIEEHFRDGGRFGCRIDYLREDQPLGTGGALSLLTEAPEHTLLVLNGDLVTQFDVGRLLSQHNSGGFAITVGVHEYVHRVPFGVVETDGERLTGLREKPAATWLANAGIYAIEPRLIPRVPRGTMYPLPALVEDCLDRGESAGWFRIDDDWTDVGQHRELLRATGKGDRP